MRYELNVPCQAIRHRPDRGGRFLTCESKEDVQSILLARQSEILWACAECRALLSRQGTRYVYYPATEG